MTLMNKINEGMNNNLQWLIDQYYAGVRKESNVQ